MIKVWILLAYFTGYNGHGGMGGPIVVDNLASKSECERVAANYRALPMQNDFQHICVEVWKRKEAQ